MKRGKILMIIVFVVLVIVELISRWLSNHSMEYIVKPFLLPWMALYFIMYSKKKSFRVMVLMAFFFSWLGDLMLMLAHTNEMLFYAGVGGFFFAQISYIIVFLFYHEKMGKPYLAMNPAWIILFIAYLTGILILLFPNMDDVMRPIILIYSISLIGMSMAALNRKGRVSKIVFSRVFAGSIFFVISDSLIALDKFYVDIPKASFIIILTYLIAQVLILSGLVEEQEAN